MDTKLYPTLSESVRRATPKKMPVPLSQKTHSPRKLEPETSKYFLRFGVLGVFWAFLYNLSGGVSEGKATTPFFPINNDHPQMLIHFELRKGFIMIQKESPAFLSEMLAWQRLFSGKSWRNPQTSKDSMVISN